MRVLHQLITHFWQRGVLTTEQADYLVEHGFVWARDLRHYQPRESPAENDDELAFADRPFPVVDLAPDRLEQKQEALAAPPKTKGRSSTARVPDYTVEQLGSDLREFLRSREGLRVALAKLAGKASFHESVACLRGVAQEPFQRQALKELRGAPELLAKWWECVDPEPLHTLALKAKSRGAVTRDFDFLLTAASPAGWGQARWLLKVPEVQTIVNLLDVRRKLVEAIRWLDQNHRSTLNRAMQRPARPARSWAGLSLGLVLVHNARAWRAKRKPLGYELHRTPPIGGWREAWIAALAFQAEPVIPYCVHLLGGLPEQKLSGAEDFAPKDQAIICPSEWKI